MDYAVTIQMLSHFGRLICYTVKKLLFIAKSPTLLYSVVLRISDLGRIWLNVQKESLIRFHDLAKDLD